MLTKQVPNSDILSLLAASGKGAVAGAAVGKSGVEGLLGSKLSDFSEILKTTGSLKDLSGADLLAFFSKEGKGSSEGSEASLSELFAKLESPEGRALLKGFNIEGSKLKNAEGKVISLEELASSLKGSLNKGQLTKAEGLKDPNSLKSLESENRMKLQSAHDFLNSKKAMMRNKSIEVTANGPTIVAGKSGMQQYSKETKAFEKNLIRPFSGERVEKSGGETLSSTSALSQMPDSDPMLLSVRNNSESGENTDSMLKGQASQSVDLSKVSAQNKTELMQKIGQYIENSYVAGSDNIDLVVKHDELGQFRVNAQKSGPGSQVNLEISTVTENARQFFVENEGELMKALSKSGVKVGEFKLANFTDSFKTSFGESRSNMDQGSHPGTERGDQQFAGGRSSRQGQGQEKRQRLWQEAKDFSEGLIA